MKVILNVVTGFDGKSLKPGDEINVPENVCQRWINRGIAHECEELKEEKAEVIKEEKLMVTTEPVKKAEKKSRKKKSKFKGWKVD